MLLRESPSKCFSLAYTDENRGVYSGRTPPFDCSRQEVIDLLDLAVSRQMRPIMMLMHPIENRKKAETRAKSSTKWDRTAAPILRRRRKSGFSFLGFRREGGGLTSIG